MLAKSVPRVSVIIVNWNGRRYLDGCLQALAAQTFTDFETVLVDNGSTDGSAAWVRERYPWVRLLALDANHGFAGGNNQGIRISRGELIATLNNDTVAAPDWLEALVEALEARPRVGAASSTLLFSTAPEFVASAGIVIHRDLVALDRALGLPRTALPVGITPIFGATAGAALYRRALFDDIGLFEERFFAYLEDVDLAWRARLRGWEAVHVPDAAVLHVYSGTGIEGSAFKARQQARNRIWVLLRDVPAPLLRACAPRVLLYEVLATGHALTRGSAATIQGRLEALASARYALRTRRVIQRRATEDWRRLAGELEPAPGPAATLRLRRTVANLARGAPGEAGRTP